MARLIVNPHVLCCLLRPSLTEAPSLRRSYSASSVLRTSPPPHTARPGSRELPVDPICDHRWGFPCCVWSPVSACCRHYPGRSERPNRSVTNPSTSAFPKFRVGRLLHYGFRGLFSVHSRYGLQTRQVALCDPLHRRLRRFCCLHRRSNCYRVERSSSRAGLSFPLWTSAFSRRTDKSPLRSLTLRVVRTRRDFYAAFTNVLSSTAFRI